jgi:hypothetical protein
MNDQKKVRSLVNVGVEVRQANRVEFINELELNGMHLLMLCYHTENIVLFIRLVKLQNIAAFQKSFYQI